MSQLTRYQQDGLELFIDVDGSVWASQSALARMCGVSQSTMSKFLTHSQTRFKTAEIHTTTGLKTHSLYSEDTILSVFEKYNPALLTACAKMGLRVYLYHQVGYELEIKKPVELPPADVRVKDLVNSLEKLGFDLTNPRYNQALKDYVGDILGVTALPSSEPQEQWVGVVERAEELGYSQAKKLEVRSLLGRFVSKHGKDTLQTKMEKRLCNGTQREIKLYLVCNELDNYIRCFFAG